MENAFHGLHRPIVCSRSPGYLARLCRRAGRPVICSKFRDYPMFVGDCHRSSSVTSMGVPIVGQLQRRGAHLSFQIPGLFRSLHPFDLSTPMSGVAWRTARRPTRRASRRRCIPDGFSFRWRGWETYKSFSWHGRSCNGASSSRGDERRVRERVQLEGRLPAMGDEGAVGRS